MRPGVKFQVHYQNFRGIDSNTWSAYSKRILTLQNEQLGLHVAIWACSSSVEHNKNK